jgi:sulfur carrier protein
VSGAGAAEIEVVVNGELRRLARGSRLADLLAAAGRDPRTVAVEHNCRILRRDELDLELAAGDRLEIVHFVQGGSGRRQAGRRRGRESCQGPRGLDIVGGDWAASSTGRAADS